MLSGDLADTIMNIVTFAFIGVLIWLLVRNLPDRDEAARVDPADAAASAPDRADP